MKVLIDTHAFLWYFTADSRLSKIGLTPMADVRNELFLSMASICEVGIKVSIGKLTLPGPLGNLIPQQLKQANIALMNMTIDHVATVTALPFHHKDPFDRMLAAQCLVEKIPLLSADAVLDQYGLSRIW